MAGGEKKRYVEVGTVMLLEVFWECCDVALTDVPQHSGHADAEPVGSFG